MPIVTEVKFCIPNFTTPDRTKNQWAEVLGVDAARILEKAELVISNQEDFSDKLAGPSSAGFSPMIKSTFRSKSGKTASQIKKNQLVNLARSYDKWKAKLDFQFATVDEVVGARFKDSVNASKDSMAAGLAERTLPLTGTRVEGRGLTALAGLWLTGDKRVEGMLRPGDDVVFGGAYLVAPKTKAFVLRSQLAQLLTYVGSEIIKSSWNAALMVTLNQLISECVQGLVDSGLDLIPFVGGSPNSFVDFKIDPVLGKILHIRVTKM